MFSLGCGPFPGCQWQIKVYRDFPTKNVIIQVVTVTGKGPYPSYHCVFKTFKAKMDAEHPGDGFSPWELGMTGVTVGLFPGRTHRSL